MNIKDLHDKTDVLTNYRKQNRRADINIKFIFTWNMNDEISNLIVMRVHFCTQK